MNVGFLEVQKLDRYDCLVFQDADLLPESDKNLYMCDQHARHLASAINEMRYQYARLDFVSWFLFVFRYHRGWICWVLPGAMVHQIRVSKVNEVVCGYDGTVI